MSTLNGKSTLTGKVAVVTGGNSGIGLATARTLLDEGARVAIVGRRQEALDEALGQLNANGHAIAVRADVAQLDDLDRLYETVNAELGGIDILVVNAGIAPFRPIDQVDEAFFDHLFDVDVKGAYFTVQRALPVLNEGASVVLVTSVASTKGMPGLTLYSAAKAALRSLARGLSAELAEKRVRVNAVSPGPIETPLYGKTGMSTEMQEQFGEQVTSQVPLGRMGQPDEVAHAIRFFASDESSYILGTELVVDGGMTQL